MYKRQGLRWFKVQPDRMRKAREAFDFFMQMIHAPIPRIAVENPRGFTWQWYKRPDQIIHPYHFGHPMTKATCLWLKNVAPLMATLIVSDPFVNWTKYKGSHNGHDRSRTFTGIAEAMAAQWGGQLPYQPNLIDHQQLIVRSTTSCYNSSIRITASAVVGSTAPAIITGKDTSE